MAIFDRIPIWAFFVLTAAFCFLAGELGFRAGRWLHRRYPDAEKGSSIGVLAGGLLGLLAFLLAFSIGLALNMFKSRMDLVAAEANAIGTSYLRAGFLEEPDRTETRDLLREYVDVRLSAVDPAKTEDAVARSEEIHSRLWAIMEANGRANLQSYIIGLLVDSVNEVIDLHTMRLLTGALRVPRLLWLVFYATAALSFGLVGLINSSDNRRNLVTLVLFALVVASVLVLIIDLDGAQTGQLRVVQQPLLDLQKQIAVP